MIRLTIFGQLPSGKNRKIQSKHGVFKNPAVVAYERDFLLQVPLALQQGIGSLERPLRTELHVWYRSTRSDLSPELVYDLLQKAGVIANDRYIREKHEYAYVDSANPRVQVTVVEIMELQ